MESAQQIIDYILDAARQDAEKQRAQAEEKAAARLAETEAAARQKQKEILARAQADTERAAQAAESAAELARRERLLLERRRLVDEALDKTIAHVLEMPAEAYFARMGGDDPGGGPGGAGRPVAGRAGFRPVCRPDFMAGLQTSLAEGRRVELSVQPTDIGGGFLLRYDEIEIDCRLTALAEAKREELEDFLARELFPPED